MVQYAPVGWWGRSGRLLTDMLPSCSIQLMMDLKPTNYIKLGSHHLTCKRRLTSGPTLNIYRKDREVHFSQEY